MTFNEWLEKTKTQKIFLFNLQCAKKQTGFVICGSGPAYFIAMSPEISGVEENGSAYTKRTSIALVEANAGSWYWDLAAARLYIHTTGSDDPAGYTIVLLHTLYLANMKRKPFNSRYYDPRVTGIPSFKREMQQVFYGRSMASFGDIQIAYDSAALSYLKDWTFAGQPFSVKLGGPELADGDYTTVLAGVCDKVPEITKKAIRIPVRDNTRLLKKKIPTTFLALGANVPEKSVGKPIPECYGTVYNVQPLFTNSSTNEYQVRNGRIKDVLAVYEDGVATALTVTKDLNNGKFRLSGPATGTVTCDLEGAYDGSTFWDLPGEVKKKILDDYLPDLNYVTADFTQLDTDRPYELGIYLDRQVEIGQVFDDIDLSVCATSGFNRIGEFTTAAIALPGSAASVTFSSSPNEYIKFALSKNKVPDVVWRVTVEYRVDSSKTGDDDLTRREAAEDSTILYLYPAADEKTIKSLLRDQADAAAVAALYLALLGTQLWFPQFTTKIKPFRVQFLEDVRVVNSDYGVDGYYTVIGINEDYAKSEVTLFCYGDD